jgi:diguanylate cyclase (GGDEF)-like protein
VVHENNPREATTSHGTSDRSFVNSVIHWNSLLSIFLECMQGNSVFPSAEESVVRTGRESVPARTRRVLSRLILSNSPKQKLLLIRSLTSMVVYIVAILMVEYSVYNGLIEAPHKVHWLQLGMLAWMVGVYVFLRSGLNWLLSDPGLTQVQILGANTWVILGYALCPPLRGGMMTIIVLILVFGIFEQNRRGQTFVNLWTLAVFGAVQWYMSRHYPDDFPFRIEMFHWAMMATIMPIVSMLGAQLNQLRVKLQVQRSELLEALDRIREMAQHDELTALFNRHYMNDLLATTARQMERSSQTFSVCIIDVDHFKKVNDTYGHRIGDEVLRCFATQASADLRPTDTLARWGGEEFLLLMSDTRAEQALARVLRLHAATSELVFADAPNLRVTFSTGIAQFRPNESIDSLIERADQALYKAKNGGRNQTILASTR